MVFKSKAIMLILLAENKWKPFVKLCCHLNECESVVLYESVLSGNTRERRISQSTPETEDISLISAYSYCCLGQAFRALVCIWKCQSKPIADCTKNTCLIDFQESNGKLKTAPLKVQPMTAMEKGAGEWIGFLEFLSGQGADLRLPLSTPYGSSPGGDHKIVVFSRCRALGAEGLAS